MGKATVEQYTSLVAGAAAFAVRAHDGQIRKGTQWPYVMHPIGVAHILRDCYPDDEALEAAGYLHDVLEDTDTKPEEIATRFGVDVMMLVLGVTNTPERNWSLAHYASEPRILRLKAADTLDNVLDTVRGLEKGHDVWSRFAAGPRKADTWRRHADLIWKQLVGEPLAVRLHDAVLRAEALRG